MTDEIFKAACVQAAATALTHNYTNLKDDGGHSPSYSIDPDDVAAFATFLYDSTETLRKLP